MILIYGRLDDPPLARTVEALEEAGAKFVVLEQTAILTVAILLVRHNISALRHGSINLKRYRELFAQGKWAEAGKELEAVEAAAGWQ